MRVHRLVLLALAAPILAVGVVLWFLLPGSVAGLTYAPGQFDREVVLRPLYWTSHDVTLRGYVRAALCPGEPCPPRAVTLGNNPIASGSPTVAADPTQDVFLLPQRESGWHSLLRNALPQYVSSPVSPRDAGRTVTITGRLVAGYSPGQVPIVQPNAL